MRIGIGNDHSALELKAEIIELLEARGHEVVDYGTNSAESCDYPIYGEKVGRAVVSGEVDKRNPDLRNRARNLSCGEQSERSPRSRVQRPIYSKNVKST